VLRKRPDSHRQSSGFGTSRQSAATRSQYQRRSMHELHSQGGAGRSSSGRSQDEPPTSQDRHSDQVTQSSTAPSCGTTRRSATSPASRRTRSRPSWRTNWRDDETRLGFPRRRRDGRARSRARHRVRDDVGDPVGARDRLRPFGGRASRPGCVCSSQSPKSQRYSPAINPRQPSWKRSQRAPMGA
jgi:hypothetical protein